jgi:hypothetical protein
MNETWEKYDFDQINRFFTIVINLIKVKLLKLNIQIILIRTL